MNCKRFDALLIISLVLLFRFKLSIMVIPSTLGDTTFSNGTSFSNRGGEGGTYSYIRVLHY